MWTKESYIHECETIMYDSSLKYCLSHLLPAGMPENGIAYALDRILKGVQVVQSENGVKPVVTSDRILFLWQTWWRHGSPLGCRLVYHKDFAVAAGVDDPNRPKVGLWGVGILALEMAYGSLPENITPEQTVTMANNMMRILTQKVNLGGSNGPKKIKKLPARLAMLLDEDYVSRRAGKLEKKKNAGGILKIMRGIESTVASLAVMDARSFSRNFLEVVMRCLDKEQPLTIVQILNLPFFTQQRS